MTTPPVSAAESPVHDRDGAAPALRRFEVRTAPAAVPPTDTAPRPSTPLELGHRSRGRAIKDVIARIVMWASFGLAMVPLVWILFTVISRGVSLLLESQWWTNSQRNINSTDVGGGAIHAIQGTLIQAGVTFKRAYALGNFAKFVRPGMSRIGATASPATDILVSAYRDDSRLSIVAVNASGQAHQQTFIVAGSTLGQIVPWVTSDAASLAKQSPVTATDNFSYQLPAKSVVMLTLTPAG